MKKTTRQAIGLTAVGLSAAVLSASPVAAATADTESAGKSTTATSRQVHVMSPVADRVFGFAGGGVGKVDQTLGLGGDAAGNAYYATDYSVIRVSPTGERTEFALPDGYPYPVLTFAVAPDGTIVVLAEDRSTGKAEFLRARPGGSFKVISTNFTRTSPGGYMAINPIDGRLWQLNSTSIGWSDVSVMSDDSFIKVFKAPLRPTTPAGYAGDGSPLSGDTRFNDARAIAFSPQGDVYVADAGNNRIRKIDGESKVITTVAGNGERGFSGDGGIGTDASIDNPTSLAVDAAGNVYFADTANDRIRMLDGYGTISTVIGSGIGDELTMGSPAPTASLHEPSNVSVTGTGTLVFTSALTEKGDQTLLTSQPLPNMRLATNPLPADMGADGHSTLLLPRGDAGERSATSFDIGDVSLVPNEDGTKFVSGEHELMSQANGALFTVRAESVEFWVTNPMVFSNVLLFHNVTVSHTAEDGTVYETKLESLSLTYERGFGNSPVITSPPTPMPWGDMVIGDLRDAGGNLDPANAKLAGEWIMKIGVTLHPEFS